MSIDEDSNEVMNSEEQRNNMALTGRITGKAAEYNQTSPVTLSFLTDDKKELKSSINLQNESDTVEQPRRQKYKEALTQSVSVRRLYDRRHLNALDKKLKEWHILTKCPTLALTLVGNKIFYSGTRSPKWNEMIRPAWWPQRMPFGDPNNSKPRLSAEQLHSIIAAYSSYTVFSEDDTGGAQCGDGSEENHHDARDYDGGDDVDVNNDASDDVNTINTEDYVVEDGFRHDCVGDDDPCRVGGDTDWVHNDDAGGEIDVSGDDLFEEDCDAGVGSGGINVSNVRVHDLGQERPLTSTHSDAVLDMVNMLNSCSAIYDDDDERKILRFLKGVKIWSDFVMCMKEVDTRTKLISAYEKPMEEQQFTRVRGIEKCSKRRPGTSES